MFYRHSDMSSFTLIFIRFYCILTHPHLHCNVWVSVMLKNILLVGYLLCINRKRVSLAQVHCNFTSLKVLNLSQINVVKGLLSLFFSACPQLMINCLSIGTHTISFRWEMTSHIIIHERYLFSIKYCFKVEL